MINIIYSEFLKLKKSNFLFLIIAGSLTMPVIMNIAILISKDKNRTFDSYAYNIEQISCMLIYGILFSIISGYVFLREYSDKTASTIYSYTCNRTKIFIGKLIIIYSAMFLVYFLQCIFIYIGYFKLFEVIGTNVLIKDIKANVYSLLCQMMITSIPVFLANFKKTFIIPLVYGIAETCTFLFFGDNLWKYIEYIPLLSPYLIFKSFYIDCGINIQHIMISAFICFLMFISLALYEHNKADIV